MDWSSIITALIAALIPTGGIVTIFTLSEKKSAMILDNAKQLADSYKSLADEYRERESDTQKRSRDREGELLDRCAHKEDELMLQIKLNSSLRHTLDDLNTENAVLKMMRCAKYASCPQKEPPMNSEVEGIIGKNRERTKKLYNDNNNGQGTDD